MSVPSPEHVVRQLFDARARGDVRRVVALLDPEIEARWSDGAEPARGIAEARELLARETSGQRRVEVHAQRVALEPDGTVLVSGRMRVHDGGGLADSPARWRVVVRRGRIASLAPARAERRLRRAA